MAGRKDYFYPDKDNKVTLTFISKNEPFRGYWTRSEEYVLNLMKKYIKDYARKKRNTLFLDAGCGKGRLLPEFAWSFDRILAIDPDCSWLDIARTNANRHSYAKKAVFECTSIEDLDLKAGSVDVILCSHVLQHVHTNSIPIILGKFGRFLIEGGLLFIMTCHSKKSHDSYAKSYLKDGTVVREAISENEFNALVFNEIHIVPLHFFSKENTIERLVGFGFKILEFKSLHILNRIPLIDHIIFRDRFFNFFSPLQSKVGEDMFIALENP